MSNVAALPPAGDFQQCGHCVTLSLLSSGVPPASSQVKHQGVMAQPFTCIKLLLLSCLVADRLSRSAGASGPYPEFSGTTLASPQGPLVSLHPSARCWKLRKVLLQNLFERKTARGFFPILQIFQECLLSSLRRMCASVSISVIKKETSLGCGTQKQSVLRKWGVGGSSE